MRRLLIPFFLILSFSVLRGQGDTLKLFKNELSGFVRTGFFGNLHSGSDQIISSLYSDAGFKAEAGNGSYFKAYTDLRFRYGTEFGETISRLNAREAYIELTGRKWDLAAGQKIVKWGRADFTNPTSKLNPQNLAFRSLDEEDMDIGNLIVQLRLYPVSSLSFEAVAVPYYRSSTMIIRPISLPSYVTIDQIDSLVTGKKMFSFGLKGNLHLNGADLSVSFFNGYDPMPGTALKSFNLDMSGPEPVPETKLAMTQYKISNIGFDFETTAGSVGLRGEAAFSIPYKSYKEFEYSPMKEIRWVAGSDWSSGNWNFILEYSGKTIPGFTPATVAPLLGTQVDFSTLLAEVTASGLSLTEYLRQEVGAFNRLYNYQMKRSYHSFGFKVQNELLYGKMTLSLFSLYNFTSHDLLAIPQVMIKPYDGVTISLGADIYSGKKGSIYDIVDDFMNCIKAGLRIDF